MSSPAEKKDHLEDSADRACGRESTGLTIKLLALLGERAELALEIGHLKRANGADVYQPLREQQIIEGLLRHNPGPLSNEHIRRIFIEMISACRALERELRVAYLGPEYSYTHLAAVNRFGASAEMVSAESIAAVFAALDGGRADLGRGAGGELDRRIGLADAGSAGETPLQIVGELILPVRHALLSVSGDKTAIRKIISHQQSLAQCRIYLSTNYPQCPQEAVASNSLAAKMAGQDPDSAAIASAQAAAPYGLRVVADGIQDVAQNITRFLVIGREPVGRSGADKTTLIFAVPRESGRAEGSADHLRPQFHQPEHDSVAAAALAALGIHLFRRPQGSSRRSRDASARWKRSNAKPFF